MNPVRNKEIYVSENSKNMSFGPTPLWLRLKPNVPGFNKSKHTDINVSLLPRYTRPSVESNKLHDIIGLILDCNLPPLETEHQGIENYIDYK